MSSDKFVRSCEFHKQDPENVKKSLLNTVPTDISDQDKANYLNWRIKQLMIYLLIFLKAETNVGTKMVFFIETVICLQ
jgi:hypothetical protein